jgi:DNA-binding transcriptional ArsR family regulator
MENTPFGDANIAAVAVLMSEPPRAAMLAALADGRALPAGELAYRAQVTAQTASTHLSKLVEGGLLVVEAHGRHRYYKLAHHRVAEALEALAVLAPPHRIRSLRASLEAERLRFARTCYDHLAGSLGVQLTQRLVEMQVLTITEQTSEVTQEGMTFLIQFGVNVGQVRQQHRAFTRLCLDWSERRSHLAGSVGAALAQRLLELEWIRRIPKNRAVLVTECGQEGLLKHFGLNMRMK